MRRHVWTMPPSSAIRRRPLAWGRSLPMLWRCFRCALKLVSRLPRRCRLRPPAWRCGLVREAARVGVSPLWRAVAFGTVVEAGNRVRGVTAATPWGPVAVLAGVTIDATGDGDLAAFAGAEFVYGAEGDFSTMWCSL